MSERVCNGCTALVGKWSRFCMDCHFARRDIPQRAAHTEVARARRKGLLADPRTLNCTDCARPATEYDHREYAQPLKVDPVCRSCNLRRGPAIDSAARDTSRIQPGRSKSTQQVGG